MTIAKVLAAVAIALVPLPTVAGPITYGFSSGDHSASAQFERSGTDLILTLTNTSTADALLPTDILTAVFFEIGGDPALSRISAVVPLGSSVLVGGTGLDVTPLDRIVGGEWAYENSIIEVPPQNGGVSSTGIDIFGSGDRFPGPNLQGPNSPDGVQYGLTSAGDNLLTGNGGLSGEHLIKNSVVFTLGGFSGEPDVEILSASFLYGTSLDEPQFDGHVPEPGSLTLAAFAAAALMGVLWRRRRRRRLVMKTI
jgi:PEP-CTERM motif